MTRLRTFAHKNTPDDIVQQLFSLKDTKDWKLNTARKKIIEEENPSQLIRSITYRPFDSRFIIYSEHLIDRPREEVMQNFSKKNLALGIGRQGYVVGDDHPWNLSFISNKILDVNLFYRGGVNVFPLYLYKPGEKKKRGSLQSMILFEPEAEYGSEGIKPNIASKVIEQFEKAYKRKPTPEQILYYCYAILYSNTYREKYAEFLKIDFPRIPFTNDYELLLQLSVLGEELGQLHLLQGKAFNKPFAKFRGSGDSVIEKPVFITDKKLLYINKDQYFEGITQEIWEYHIGGYQVLKKYLDSRKGRALDPQDDFFKIITAISKTISLQTQIDVVFESIENTVISV